MPPDTTEYINLGNGHYAALVRSMTYGDVVLILLLVPILFLLVYVLWLQLRPSLAKSESYPIE